MTKKPQMIPEFLDVPIFPLPNVTFFPRTLLPLHVFEPRYREMIGNCLAGDRLLGVALLREGWQKDYFGRPPIYKTFGVGKIVDHEHYENDCYDIVVEGLYRTRLITEYSTNPFRTGRVTVIQDGPIDHLRDEVQVVQKELHESCRQLAEAMPEYRETLRNAWGSHPHPAVVADRLAAALVVDTYDRQSILEETNALRRMNLVLVQVRRILFQLSQNKVEAEAFEEEVYEEE